MTRARRSFVQYLTAAALTALYAASAAVYAETATVLFRPVGDEGNPVVRNYELTPFPEGELLHISASEVPEGTQFVDVRHPWQTAKAGESGYFAFANGMYGTWRDLPDGNYVNPHRVMQTYAVATPRGGTATVLTSFNHEGHERVVVQNNTWIVYVRYILNGDKPYEDIEIRYYTLPSDATLADMAKVYRDYQYERGEIRSLKEKIAERPELAYAVEAPEIRVRLGWKPVPSPVKEQNAQNEPEMHVAITFDRFKQIVDEFKRQGVDKAEFCLVGWNVGGHDGRYPQIFPPDERLGGEAKLKEAVAYAQSQGYQVVCHQNYSDAYQASQIGGLWDENYLLVRKDGQYNTYTTWGGGAMYETCPKEMLARFPKTDFPKLQELGFRGLHYIDVYSTVEPRACYSKEHPVNRKEFAEYVKELERMAQESFGGFASEGGFDYCIKYLDDALYLTFSKPHGPYPNLVERYVPYWQLVYHGAVMSNPCTETTNYTAQAPIDRLKLIEFGGRPHFYFYSKFKSDGKHWMGDGDLTCATDEELRESVAKIKEGSDEYKRLMRLQLELMTSHEQISEKVFKTGYSDGTIVLCNYREEPFEWNGKTIPAVSYIIDKE